jgi:4-amino-4-deoxy-L-arabinose transferase-like glycosyltransferase
MLAGVKRAPLAIFGLAFAVRAIYLLQARADPLHDFVYALADSLHYHRQALALLDGALVGDAPYFLGPLYGWLLAGVYALAGPSLEAVRWLQALLGAASCVLLLRIGARLFGDRVGVLAGTLLGLYGLHVYYTGVLLPTVLVVFLNLAFLLLLLRALEAPSPGRAAAAGAVLGLAVLAKSNALLLLPAALLLARFGAGSFERGRGAWCAALAGAALLAIAPATLHNALASERFVLVTTSTGRNLWKGNGPHANGSHPLGHREGDRAGLGRRLWGEVEAAEAVDESGSYMARTVSHVLSEPGRTAGLLVRKTALFWNAAELAVRDNFHFARRYSSLLGLPLPAFAWIAPLGIAGMVSAWRRRPRPDALYALLAVQLVSFVAVFVLARYRLVAVACLVLFASHELVRWWDAARSRTPGAALPGLAVAAVAAVLVNLPFAGLTRERGFALQYEKLGDRHALASQAGPALEAYRLALDADWQDLDPALKRGTTRLRMARVQAADGDTAAARASLDALLADLPTGGEPARRLAEDARALRVELGDDPVSR